MSESPSTVDSAAASEEIARLREEVTALRSRLDTRRARQRTRAAARRMAAGILAALAALCVVVSVVGLWSAYTVVDTDRWVSTVAPLPRNPQVSAAVAQYTTDAVARAVDIDGRLREVLPAPAAFVIDPLAGQVRAYVRRTVDQIVRGDRFQAFWVAANRQAHEQALAILRGTSDVASVAGDRVDIDLMPLVTMVLRALTTQLPTLFGHQITLPDLDGVSLPPNLRATVQNALGITLPADFGRFTVYDSGRLHALQVALVRFRRYLALLVTGTVLMLAATFAVSPGRRRTAVQFGLWLVVAAVVVATGLRVVRGQLIARVPAGTYRDGASAAVGIVTSGLRTRGVQLIWSGALLALAAYLAGPGRLPTWLRGVLRTGTRRGLVAARDGARWLRAHGPGLAARHRDALRVGGVALAAVLILLASSWVAVLAVLAVLAAYLVAVTLVRGPASPIRGPAPPVRGPAAAPQSPGGDEAPRVGAA